MELSSWHTHMAADHCFVLDPVTGNSTGAQDSACILRHTTAAYYYAKRALELPLPTGVRKSSVRVFLFCAVRGTLHGLAGASSFKIWKLLRGTD